MKNQSYFFGILFLFSIPSVLPMENKNKIVIGPKINDIEFPTKIFYFDNDHIIIQNENRFNIINIRQPAAKHISQSKDKLGALKAVIPMANTGNKILMLHNCGIQEYNSDTDTYNAPIKTDAFKFLYTYVHHPLSNSVLFPMSFYPHAIRRYDYIAHEATTSLALERDICTISVHPKKEIVCTGDYQGNISMYHFDDLSEPIHKIKLAIQADGVYFCEYTPQGDNIVVVVNETIFNIDVNIDAGSKPTFTYSHVHRTGHKIYGSPIMFHPNGILAMVCKFSQTKQSEYLAHYTLRYWDTTQNKFIYTTPEIEGPIIKYLIFSPHGREYALFLADHTCEIHPVPFEVLYQCNAKQILCYSLSLLNRLHREQNLPQDIKRYIAHILLAALKR